MKIPGWNLIVIELLMISLGASYLLSQTPFPQRSTFNGVTVDFSAEPTAVSPTTALSEGAEARVKFVITDNTGKAMVGLHPSAWIGVREATLPPDARECQARRRLVACAFRDFAGAFFR